MNAPRALLRRLVPRLDAVAPTNLSGKGLNRFVGVQ